MGTGFSIDSATVIAHEFPLARNRKAALPLRLSSHQNNLAHMRMAFH